MTKTLTEQFWDKELNGWYYVKMKKNTPLCGESVEMASLSDEISQFQEEYLKEVLAPVPSYDKHNKLKKLPLKCFQLEEDNSALMVINKDMCKEKERIEKKLEIATKALKEYANCKPTEWMSCVTADKALKEMEGIK